METLTKENASKVKSIENILHPEWGIKRFNYKSQSLNDGEYIHTFGIGANSVILDESEFRFWYIIEFKEETKQTIDVFSKLDNVKIDVFSKLKQHITYQINFEVQQHAIRKKLIDEIQKEFAKLDFSKIELNDGYHQTKHDSHSSFYSSCSETINSKKTGLFSKYNVNNQIIYHNIILILNSEYNLKIIEGDIFSNLDNKYGKNNENINKVKKYFPNNNVNVDMILNDLLHDFVDLDNAKVNNIIKDFHNNLTTIRDWKNEDKDGYFDLKLSKNNLSLSRHVYIENDWNGGKRLSYSTSERLKPLSEALNYYFETKHQTSIRFCDYINTMRDEKIFEYSFTQFDIKIFNNGRVDIKFKESNDAENFYKMFKLNEKVR